LVIGIFGLSGLGWICLVGATGTGKTAAALALAERFAVDVINADSRQVYGDLPIITAQPTLEEQARCPHRLYGFMDLSQSISAGRFAELARAELKSSREKGRIPVLVGGTGLYLRALAGGLASLPEVSKEIRQGLLQECSELGPEALHERLQRLDPEYAAKIHPRDRQRVTRALEVCLATGRSFSWWHAQQKARSELGPGQSPKVIGLRLDRGELQARLAKRIEAMVAWGAIHELERAWDKCPDAAAPGFLSIGCRELLGFLRGEATLDQAKAQWLSRTRAYAKRQETWFKNMPDVSWLAADDVAALFRTFST
jgi:tRNA dimethylallyltransferase